jgi:predicted ATPase with chaperone activity
MAKKQRVSAPAVTTATQKEGRCRCTPERVQRYLEKISGPLLNRIRI